MYGADNPERNNPVSSADWLRLLQAHVDPWPRLQSLTGAALPRSCAAHCAIAEEPNGFQKHASSSQGYT